MAARKKGRKTAHPNKFHVNLNGANWPDFADDSELQGFLNSHVSGVVEGKAKRGGRKSVSLKVTLAPKGGPSASTSDVAYVMICPRPPC